MSKKKYVPVAKTPAETAPVLKAKGFEPQQGDFWKKMFFVSTALALVFAVILGFTLFVGSSSGGSKSDSDIETVLGKSYVDLGKREQAQDPEDLNTKIDFWTWTDRNNAWGYCSVVPVDGYPSILVITDPNLKIMRLMQTTEFSVAGGDKRAEFEKILENYEGRTLQDFTNLESTIGDTETRFFREMLRDGIAQTLKILYVKMNTKEVFDSHFPQGIKFAKIGTKLNPWKTFNADGEEVSSSTLGGSKYAIFATTSCGSCINTVMGFAQKLETEGRMSPKQIIIVFTAAKEKVDFLKGQMKGEHLVMDENMKGIGKELNLFEGPSMMLVNSDGVVFSKETNTTLNDTTSMDKVLQEFHKLP